MRELEELCGEFGRIAEAAGEVVLAPHSVTELFSGRRKPRATFEWTILDGSSEHTVVVLSTLTIDLNYCRNCTGKDEGNRRHEKLKGKAALISKIKRACRTRVCNFERPLLI